MTIKELVDTVQHDNRKFDHSQKNKDQREHTQKECTRKTR